MQLIIGPRSLSYFFMFNRPLLSLLRVPLDTPLPFLRVIFESTSISSAEGGELHAFPFLCSGEVGIDALPVPEIRPTLLELWIHAADIPHDGSRGRAVHRNARCRRAGRRGGIPRRQFVVDLSGEIFEDGGDARPSETHFLPIEFGFEAAGHCCDGRRRRGGRGRKVIGGGIGRRSAWLNWIGVVAVGSR